MNTDKFLQDGQDPKVVEKIYDKIIDMLTSGESINYIAVQKKPAVNFLPDSITVSNKRLFLCEFTKLGLATNFEIFDWKEIKDITFKEEIFGAKVTVIPFVNENFTIDYIPKTQARKLYQLIKEALANDKVEGHNTSDTSLLAVSAEKEDKPDISPLPSPSPTVHKTINQTFARSVDTPVDTAPPILSPDDTITKKLTKLKTLYDKQLITQAEYEGKKSELLSEL